MAKAIGIIDADLLCKGSRHPNLALMKISGYEKEIGNDVTLIYDYSQIPEFEKVYISKVFSFSQVPVRISDFNNIEIGGTGFFPNNGPKLPYVIEHHMPDYNLYDEYIDEQVRKGKDKKRFFDYQNFSIGFTTRGCFRHCEFCVNRNCDKVESHSPVSEFFNKERHGIYLWDDNFLGYPFWEGIFDQLIETGKPFQFRQGLDIRLLTERKAKKLAAARYYGDYVFAFDDIKEKMIIEKKLKLWRAHTNKSTKLFVLCGFKSIGINDIVETFARIKILMRFGCLPYIMRYENYKNSEFRNLYVQIARWCNQPRFFKKLSFREYCVANQEYHEINGNPLTKCICYKTMIDFEQHYPEVAKEYFDMKFEFELNSPIT